MIWNVFVCILVLYTHAKPTQGTYISQENCKFYYQEWYKAFFDSDPRGGDGDISQTQCQKYAQWYYNNKKTTTPKTTPPSTSAPTTTPKATPPPTSAPTTTPDPCKCPAPGGRHFAFVGRVDNPSFTPHVVPTGYVSALVTNVARSCLTGVHEPLLSQQVRINTPIRTGCPDAFDNLVAGQTYIFYGTFITLAPDHRRSYVVDQCDTPCRANACVATSRPTPCVT